VPSLSRKRPVTHFERDNIKHSVRGNVKYKSLGRGKIITNVGKQNGESDVIYGNRIREENPNNSEDGHCLVRKLEITLVSKF